MGPAQQERGQRGEAAEPDGHRREVYDVGGHDHAGQRRRDRVTGQRPCGQPAGRQRDQRQRSAAAGPAEQRGWQQHGDHHEGGEAGRQHEAVLAVEHLAELGERDVPGRCAAGVRRLQPDLGQGRERGQAQPGAHQADRAAARHPAWPQQRQEQRRTDGERQSRVPEVAGRGDRDRDRAVRAVRDRLRWARGRRADRERQATADGVAVGGDHPIADEIGAQRTVGLSHRDAEHGARRGGRAGDPFAVRREDLDPALDRRDTLTERDDDLGRGRPDDAAGCRVRAQQCRVCAGRGGGPEQRAEPDDGHDQYAGQPTAGTVRPTGAPRPPDRRHPCHDK